ncbi:MAG: aminotransferase class IV [Proteobacteria bacterium]|nr:aminotransferase class IV [Pseudomonadota bacterium]
MSVPADDRGLLLSDGLFETILWSDGRPVLFEAHAERMIRGCVTLGLPTPEPDALRAAAEEAVASIAAPRIAVRLTWTAGSGGRGLDRPGEAKPRLIASAAPAPRPQGFATLITSTVRRNEGSPASRLKTLAYLDNVLARREARGAGADEALMLNLAGEVACAAAANLFWFERRDLTVTAPTLHTDFIYEISELVTPALSCGALDGVVRSEILRLAQATGVKVREVRALRPDLDRAVGLFLTNSLIGIRPVARLDGAPVTPCSGVDELQIALSDQLSGI